MTFYLSILNLAQVGPRINNRAFREQNYVRQLYSVSEEKLQPHAFHDKIAKSQPIQTKFAGMICKKGNFEN